MAATYYGYGTVYQHGSIYQIRHTTGVSGSLPYNLTLTNGDKFTFNGVKYTYEGGADFGHVGGTEVGFFAFTPNDTLKFFAFEPKLTINYKLYLDPDQNYTTPCFALGTQIATLDGESPVENISEGDLVAVLSDGKTVYRAVKWIGQTRVNIRRHPDPDMVRPIRIAAGALSRGVPARDLVVSPDHAILVDGALIPARLLVNHRSVTEEFAMKEVTYFHVELDEHSIILAEGAATESYLDTGNRAAFTGSEDIDLSVGERLRMPQDGACMPLVTDPEAVFPTWKRIADRAGVEPFEAVAFDAGIGLIAGTRTLRPVVTEGDRLIFALPRDTTEVRLVSTAVRPSKARPWLDDRRLLGVAVKSISADHTAVALDSPALTSGWWDVEHAGNAAFRWTNGNAAMALPKGTKLLTVRVHATMAEPAQPVHAVAA